VPRGAMPSNDGCGTETHGVSFGMAGGEGRPDGTLAAEGKHSQATTRCLVTTQSCDVALPAHRQRHQRCRTPLQMKGLGHRPLDVATRHSANLVEVRPMSETWGSPKFVGHSGSGTIRATSFCH
jgi:hypothetical protein